MNKKIQYNIGMGLSAFLLVIFALVAWYITLPVLLIIFILNLLGLLKIDRVFNRFKPKGNTKKDFETRPRVSRQEVEIIDVEYTEVD